MRLRVLAAILSCLAASLSQGPLARGEQEPVTQSSGSILAEYKIDHWGEPITVPVTWQGKTVDFALDTGFTYALLDPAYFPSLRSLNKQGDISTAGGVTTMQFFRAPKLTVSPFDIADSGPVLCLNLADVRAITGRPIVGMLGMSALKGSVVQIDPDRGVIAFLRANSEPHPEWGKALPMQPNPDGIPAVVLNDGEGFTIDTGNIGELSLPKAVFDAMPPMPMRSIPAFTAKGTIELREMRIPEFSLAGFQYHDLLVEEMPPSLGIRFLERHITTLDFPNRRIYVRPGSQFNRLDLGNMCGIRAERSGDEVVAKFVDNGSPAYDAGVRPGDIIVDLNGTAAKDWDMYDIGDLFSSENGKEIAVTFRHGSVERTVKIKLHRSI